MAWSNERVFYTDGACSGNPGPGGWSYVELDHDAKSIVGFDYENLIPNTTNNRMELFAILAVCNKIKNDILYEKTTYTIYSDSAYCVNLINIWMWSWSKNGRCNSKKEEIANKDLILQLYNFFNQPNCRVKVEKVDGHNNLLGNEIADRLATGKIKEVKNLLKKEHYEVDFSSTGYFNGQLLLRNIE